ncbi:MAG: MobF family relaxase [Opitutaceae bacterium]|nr:MobF family relaxase [Opitutaceae bacterium]
MITVGTIRSGADYLSRHLRKNDYWAEGEKEVEGEWIGLGAERLQLEGQVKSKDFEALRTNRHPQTGEALTPRDAPDRVAFFDIQLSAPKDVSIVAMVGGDERVVTAFREAVKVALAEMERYAAVRDRRGKNNETENHRLTHEFAGGLFFHDASRDLDPQLHAHAVLANLTFDAERGHWMALQPAEMLRASPYVRQVLYRELATRLHALGYATTEMTATGFGIEGIGHLRERYSKRSAQVEQLAKDFQAAKGRRPTKKEFEILVRESRNDKLTEVTTEAVRRGQREQLTPKEQSDLEQLVAHARLAPLKVQASIGTPAEVLESAFRHVYERASVAREGVVLAAALTLHPRFSDWRGLRHALEQHPESLRGEGEVTLRSVKREEMDTVHRVTAGRNTRFALGDPDALPSGLTQGQEVAARALLASKDFVTVLVGDAGTGKTSVLRALDTAHRARRTDGFLVLAPTTKARDGLVEAGFADADTIQRFLVSSELQTASIGRAIVVDEAGLLSSKQLDRLTAIAESNYSRVLLIGDTKQHYSVERGDALRNILERSPIDPVRLSEVLRQKSEDDRKFSRHLAEGEIYRAFSLAERKGMLKEIGSEEDLFAHAAERVVAHRKANEDPLVVIPLWSEIERFTAKLRPALRSAGLLGNEEVKRESLNPLGWTVEQKALWHLYRENHRIVFVRRTLTYKPGETATVIKPLPNGLLIQTSSGHVRKLNGRNTESFEVGEVQQRTLSVGDLVLIRGKNETDFANGDLRRVNLVDVENDKVVLDNGKELPPSFHSWTYGHAVTAYRSQGVTAERSLLVLGDLAAQSLERRQFYVGNTRFRGSHEILLTNKMAVLTRAHQANSHRELATEFVERRQINEVERIVPRPVRRWSRTLQRAWLAIANHFPRSNSQTQKQTL